MKKQHPIKQIIKNTEYMESAIPAGKPRAIRYDYFETRARINGQRYIDKIDV